MRGDEPNATSVRRTFYQGRGFARLTGPEAQQVERARTALRKVQETESLKGNLFKPVVTAEFPGAPADLPINWLAFPDRGFDYCLIRMQPGVNLPLHIHGYGEEVYIVLGGAGFVTVGREEYDAAQWDVFHIPAGTPHGMRNPGTEGELLILAINSPPVAPELRSDYWAVPVAAEGAEDGGD